MQLDSHLALHSGIAFRRTGMLIFLVILCFGVEFASLQGDVVILKDGTTLHGKLVKEQTVITDPNSGVSIATGKINGFNLIDDGVRLTVYSTNYRQLGSVDNDYDKFASYETITKPLLPGNRKPFPAGLIFQKETQFNEKWQRTLRFVSGNGKYYHDVVQQMVKLTPYYARLDANTLGWSASFSTQELGPEMALFLLRSHPDLQQAKDKPDADKAARIVRFLIQATWLDHAEKELSSFNKLFPEEKEKAAQFRKDINEQRAELFLAVGERYKESGRISRSMELFKAIPADFLPAKSSQKLGQLKAASEALLSQEEKLKFSLQTVISKLDEAPVLKDAIKAVLAEFYPEAAGRLEPFQTLSEQAVRDAKAGKKELYTTEQLAAVALSGWLLGKTAAETNVEAAMRYWQARQLVLQYLKSKSVKLRDQLLQQYEKDSRKLSYDELAQLVANLPPFDPDPNPPTKLTETTSGPLPDLRDGVTYWIQVPSGYHPHRPTPLLIVLPDGSEKPADLMKKFGDLPDRYGMIVAMPIWNGGFRDSYSYTEEEHRLLLKTVWHLKRKYPVDCDRIFLLGKDQAGNYAFDVAASHPDLFAGVLTMSIEPRWAIMREYWRNFQRLPVYIVMGDKAGDAAKTIRQMLEQWLPKGYPVMMVSYKGRAPGWFSSELPDMFEWMTRQKRDFPTNEVGRTFGGSSASEEFRTMRPFDRAFYWAEINTIAQTHALEFNRNRVFSFTSASIYARINEGNTLMVRSAGVSDLTVWLGKGMIDFDRPVKINWNSAEIKFNQGKPLKPGLLVLLEDLYERGDKIHPFFEKIELSTTKK
jgi:predicted esterase